MTFHLCRADDRESSVSASTPSASQIFPETREEEVEGISDSMWGSQEGSTDEEVEEEEPVVCERSILRVVSSSQSFHTDQGDGLSRCLSVFYELNIISCIANNTFNLIIIG